jgi:hypothetical protein
LSPRRSLNPRPRPPGHATWSACTQRVRATASDLPEVASVEIDFDAGTATITCKPGQKVTRDTVEAALRGDGYGVTDFSVAPPTPDGG